MNKDHFKPLLRVHDEAGEFRTLLQANGFQVEKGETELLMCLSKWNRMANNGDKIPELNIKNVSAFRKLHVEFINFTAQEEQKKMMEKVEAERAARLAEAETTGTLKIS